MHGTEGADFYVPVSNASGRVRSPHTHPQYYLAEPWVYAALGMYAVFIVVVGVPGNALALWVTVSHRALRAPFYYMLVNAAAADLLAAAVGVPFTLHAAVSAHFVHGMAGCNFEGFFSAHAAAVSLWSLVVVAAERCAASFGPGAGPRARRKLAVWAAGFTWLMAFACSLPPLLEWSRYIPEGLQCSCGVDYYTAKPDLYGESYLRYVFAVHVAVPIAVVSACCARLLCHADPDQDERVAGRMTVAMALASFACRAPYAALTWDVFARGGGAFDPLSMTLSSYWAKSSVLYRPLICFCMDKRFRQGVAAALFPGKRAST